MGSDITITCATAEEMLRAFDAQVRDARRANETELALGDPDRAVEWMRAIFDPNVRAGRRALAKMVMGEWPEEAERVRAWLRAHEAEAEGQ